MSAVFVFDGDCAFCSSSVRLMQRWAPSAALVVPWQQADLTAYDLGEEECTEAAQWVDGTVRRQGAAAFAAYLRSSRPWWRVVGRVLGSRPVLLVAEPVYRWVAANRYRLPGGTPACRLPDA